MKKLIVLALFAGTASACEHGLEKSLQPATARSVIAACGAAGGKSYTAYDHWYSSPEGRMTVSCYWPVPAKEGE